MVKLRFRDRAKLLLILRVRDVNIILISAIFCAHAAHARKGKHEDPVQGRQCHRRHGRARIQGRRPGGRRAHSGGRSGHLRAGGRGGGLHRSHRCARVHRRALSQRLLLRLRGRGEVLRAIFEAGHHHSGDGQLRLLSLRSGGGEQVQGQGGRRSLPRREARLFPGVRGACRGAALCQHDPSRRARHDEDKHLRLTIPRPSPRRRSRRR